MVFLLNNLLDFIKDYEQASKSTRIPLTKPKNQHGSTFSEDNFFAQCYKDIQEYSNRELHLYFLFDQNNQCVSSIKKFDVYRDQLIFAVTVNINHEEIYSLYMNP